MNPHRLKAYIYLLIVSLIWAVAGPVIKFVLGRVDPLTFLTLRFGISSLAAILYSLKFGFHFPKKVKEIVFFIVTGFFTSTVALGLLFWGMNDTTVVESSLIELVGPIIISVFSIKLLGDHITHRERVGTAIALLGAAITTLEPILFRKQAFVISGNILILLYLFAAVIPAILTKKLLRVKIDPISLSNFSFIIGFLSFLPFLILRGNLNTVTSSIVSLPKEYIWGIIYMAILSGNLAYALSTIAQKSIEVSEAALFSYLYPLLSIPLAIFFLHEKITPTYIIGASIVLLGVVIAEFKKTRYNSRH